jgi:hypothetical protein
VDALGLARKGHDGLSEKHWMSDMLRWRDRVQCMQSYVGIARVYDKSLSNPALIDLYVPRSSRYSSIDGVSQ